MRRNSCCLREKRQIALEELKTTMKETKVSSKILIMAVLAARQTHGFGTSGPNREANMRLLTPPILRSKQLKHCTVEAVRIDVQDKYHRQRRFEKSYGTGAGRHDARWLPLSQSLST